MFGSLALPCGHVDDDDCAHSQAPYLFYCAVLCCAVPVVVPSDHAQDVGMHDGTRVQGTLSSSSLFFRHIFTSFCAALISAFDPGHIVTLCIVHCGTHARRLLPDVWCMMCTSRTKLGGALCAGWTGLGCCCPAVLHNHITT